MLYKKIKDLPSNTEEDTFNALRRPNIVEMRRIVKEEMNGHSHSDLVQFLKKNNWTVTEFISESSVVS